MFCPTCGKADQSPDTYCRACGQFLKEPASTAIASFGGRTSRENVNAISILSIIAALASVVVAILLYLTRFNEPIILYLAAAVLLCNAAWHLSNLIVSLKLRRRLIHTKARSEEQTQLTAAETRELLPVGDPATPRPLSITEDTTKNLKDKVRR